MAISKPSTTQQSRKATGKVTGAISARVAEILNIEAEAIRGAASRLDAAAVERATRLLAECAGKVVLMGAGKSGNVAAKVAATLTSTGTPAVFLHPSDAAHGGMGIIAASDVVLMFSNSGETDELVALLPSLKVRGASVVAILGNMDSTIARRADVVLDASVEREACPLNLAPTASTTVALAIGDALAIVLMTEKNLTEEDFALNHPAGRLGKRLTLRVGDLMHAVHTEQAVKIDETWLEVVRAITRGGLGAVCVVDERNVLRGIVTDGDIRRALERAGTQSGASRALDELTCLQLMTPDPVVTAPECLAYDALRLMEDRPSQISVLPVVDEEKRAVGLIRLHDIVRNGL